MIHVLAAWFQCGFRFAMLANVIQTINREVPNETELDPLSIMVCRMSKLHTNTQEQSMQNKKRDLAMRADRFFWTDLIGKSRYSLKRNKKYDIQTERMPSVLVYCIDCCDTFNPSQMCVYVCMYVYMRSLLDFCKLSG